MENPKENNKVENHHTVNAILSPTFVFSATKLADQFGYAEAEIEKDKGEVIRERELQVIEQQEELQAQLVNLNIANEVDPLESYIPPEPREMRFPAVPNLHDLNLSLPNNMGSVDQTNLTRETAPNHKP
ncbi:hypothetical protein glysoja_043781 [Glycine soja]|uniref:Uncharacterized protein n=1 Tax=Glycine soja TaxID=3848 RepID=A0A0B2R9M2_GLYSO|nr:hypothetical protein glysoja_043781 [Glycine soja]